MVNKQYGVLLLFSVCILFPAHSQEAHIQDQERVFIRQTDEGAQIVQRLFWPGDENAAQYEVIVALQEGGAWKEISREITEEEFAEYSLGPGEYRYSVSYYNLLYQLEYTTNWATFSIMLALQPIVSTSDRSAIYLLEDPKMEINLTGINFIEGAEVFLESLDVPEVRISGNLTPDRQGSIAHIEFDKDSLILGFYQLHIINPGGLEALTGPFEVAYGSPFNVNISAAYAPAFYVHGFMKDTFDKPAWPGAMIRASFIPLKRPWGYLGAEISVSWDYFSTTINSWGIAANMINFHGDLLYRKPLGRYFAFDGRLGFGLSAITGMTFKVADYGSDAYDAWYVSFNTGASLLYYFKKPFYLELGADYIYILSKDSPQPGIIRPSLALGWQY